MPWCTAPKSQPPFDIELEVLGALPSELRGRLIGVCPRGSVHSFVVRDGRVTYATRGGQLAGFVLEIVVFEGSILACTDDSSVYQLSADGGLLHRVELAGSGRDVVACPTYERATGEVHLVAREQDGSQAHVVVSAGALTRRSRTIVEAPRWIRSVVVGSDHVVFVADGVVGIATRVADARTTWVSTRCAAPRAVHTYGTNSSIVLLALTPQLERWAFHLDTGTFDRSTLDPTPRRFAHLGEADLDGPTRFVWTTGESTISRHGVAGTGDLHLDLAPRVPGDFVLVPDRTRPSAVDAGWLVGVVHDPPVGTAELWVIDMADVAGAVLATIRLPRDLPSGLRWEWLP